MPSTAMTERTPRQLDARLAQQTAEAPERVVDAGANLVGASNVDVLLRRAQALDHCVADRVRPHSLSLLRILLGIIFIWFGGLKVFGVSPVKAMVAATIPWGAPHIVVPVLGGIEVLLGLGLITAVGLRLVLPILALHLAGTFLTFVMLPSLMFRASDPLLLTQSGEFVAKNLILISATIVLITHTPRSTPIPERRAVATDG
jgi:putative oxidoreductase